MKKIDNIKTRRICSLCKQDLYCRKYCRKHYSRWYRHGNPLVVLKPRTYGNRGTPVPTKHPTLKDIYWTAGFLDGEGTFRFAASTQGVSASQNELEPLEKLQELFGGSIYKSKNHKCSSWGLWGARARGLMMTLYLLMGLRRKNQIREALKPWRS